MSNYDQQQDEVTSPSGVCNFALDYPSATYFFFLQLRQIQQPSSEKLTRRNDMEMIAEREIAVRGFMNDRYNNSFGKGLFRRAIYNGSVELGNPSQKYLIDLYEFGIWQHQAKTDYQMEVFRKIDSMGADDEKDLLMSWVLHYDALTKTKTPVDGYCLYMQSTNELYVEILDPVRGTEDRWSLTTKPCKSLGKGKPVFIATNVDLNSWSAV